MNSFSSLKASQGWARIRELATGTFSIFFFCFFSFWWRSTESQREFIDRARTPRKVASSPFLTRTGFEDEPKGQQEEAAKEDRKDGRKERKNFVKGDKNLKSVYLCGCKFTSLTTLVSRGLSGKSPFFIREKLQGLFAAAAAEERDDLIRKEVKM